ncbi:MAG: zinc finger domain-containing protein [Candidatus Woesearchaeota archaeon]
MKMDTTANVSVANDNGAVSFPCPACGEEVITRSMSSRQIVVKYTCSKCGFEGPN